MKKESNELNLSHHEIWESIKPADDELKILKLCIPNIKSQYTFTIIISKKDKATVNSIKNNIYKKYKIIIGELNAVKLAKSDYVLFLQPGDILHKHALFEIVVELNRINMTPPLLYFDHNYLVGNNYDKPFYKPGWSQDLFLVNNYIKRACVIRSDLLKNIDIEELPFYAAHYDIMLKATDKEEGHHLPGILVTFPDAYDEYSYDDNENIVRNKTIARRRINGKIETNIYGVASLKRNLTETPKVSIIIPTAFSDNFIENCLESIINISTYQNYEVIVVDNSNNPESYGQERLKNYNCKIIYVNEPYNWSRLNNIGAEAAEGEVLIFLNDDTQIITPDWLEQITVNVKRPDIAIADVLVLYPDHKVYSGFNGELFSYRSK